MEFDHSQVNLPKVILRVGRLFNELRAIRVYYASCELYGFIIRVASYSGLLYELRVIRVIFTKTQISAKI